LKLNIAILSFCFILFSGYSLFASETIILKDSISPSDISSSISVLEEKNQKYSFEEISSGKLDRLFSKNEIEETGERNLYAWAQIRIKSTLSERSDWILKTSKYYSEVACYIVYPDGKIISQQSGWSLQLKDRSVYSPENIFKVSIESNEAVTVYLHIHADVKWARFSSVESELISSGDFQQIIEDHFLFNGFFAGIYILGILFWIINYFLSRKVQYLYLAFMAFTPMMFFLDLNNILTSIFFYSYPLYSISKYGNVFIWFPLLDISIGFGLLKLLEVKQNHPGILFLFFGFVFILLISAPVCLLFLNWKHNAIVTGIVFLSYYIFLVVIMIDGWRNGVRGALFSLISSLPLIIGCGMWGILGWGIRAETASSLLTGQIGTLLSGIILFLGMVNQLYILRKKRAKEQKERELLVTNQNIMLEQKVEERTRDLKEAQAQLIEIAKQTETEKIRSRISQDIHDDISSGLNKISWMSELVKAKAQKNKMNEIEPALEKIISASRETVNKLIEIIWSVNPENDNLDSMLAYMRAYISKFFEDTAFHTTVDFPEQNLNAEINPEIKRNLFLVLKEALHNAVKYSTAKNINVKFCCEERSYVFTITDDGKGIEENVIHGSGNGMINMRKRMENIRGKFEVETGKEIGTKIILEGQLY